MNMRCLVRTVVAALALASPPLWADYDAGREARDAGNHAQAPSEWRKATNAGGRRAMPVQGVTPFRDCGECPELVEVPAGSYLMGDRHRRRNEVPVHRVTIGEPFSVGVKEVTRGEYRRFVSATGHSAGDSCWTYEGGPWKKGGRSPWKDRGGRNWEDPGYEQTDGHPVVCVSWEDARAYVGWLSRETGEEYRLLSESEWEYVARAGSRGARYWGQGEQCRHANGADASTDFSWRTGCSDGYARTAPVGSFVPNGFGLHDVLGNVWEWVEDCQHDNYAGAPSEGSAWVTGDCSLRMHRGCSWYSAPSSLRSAYRNGSLPRDRSSVKGFRVARTLTR